jgi:hypothetical protein
MMRILKLKRPQATAPKGDDQTAQRLDALSARIDAMDRRLKTVEMVLRGIYGEGVFGSARPAKPPPEPERPLRPVATVRF